MNPTVPLRKLMARQHARCQVLDFVKEHGAEFVIAVVQEHEDRERRRADEEWRKRCAERDAYVASLAATPQSGG